MKFVTLLTGSGEGCDFTIACNKDFVVFDAVDVREALQKCAKIWEDHGGAGGEPRIEEMLLFSIYEEIHVPIDFWNEEGAAEDERKEAEEELKELEEKARELRLKLRKKGAPV